MGWGRVQLYISFLFQYTHSKKETDTIIIIIKMPPNPGTTTRSHQQQQNKNHNNNDLKSLRAQFKLSLSSLTELFPEWSQDDLLFVMDECQGDLDLAITRITEGLYNRILR